MFTTRPRPRRERRPERDSDPEDAGASAACGGRPRCWCKIESEGQETKHQQPPGTIYLSGPEIGPKNRSHPCIRRAYVTARKSPRLRRESSADSGSRPPKRMLSSNLRAQASTSARIAADVCNV